MFFVKFMDSSFVRLSKVSGSMHLMEFEANEMKVKSKLWVKRSPGRNSMAFWVIESSVRNLKPKNIKNCKLPKWGHKKFEISRPKKQF